MILIRYAGEGGITGERGSRYAVQGGIARGRGISGAREGGISMLGYMAGDGAVMVAAALHKDAQALLYNDTCARWAGDYLEADGMMGD